MKKKINEHSFSIVVLNLISLVNFRVIVLNYFIVVIYCNNL